MDYFLAILFATVLVRLLMFIWSFFSRLGDSDHDEPSISTEDLKKSDIINYFLEDEGVNFKTREGDEVKGFIWSQVQKVETYKIDLMVYDEVALKFVTDIGTYEILEGHSAFHELIPRLHEFFDLDKEWYLEVIDTAFKANHQVLFERT